MKGKVITFKNYTPLVSEMHQTIKREKKWPYRFQGENENFRLLTIDGRRWSEPNA